MSTNLPINPKIAPKKLSINIKIFSDATKKVSGRLPPFDTPFVGFDKRLSSRGSFGEIRKSW